MPWSGFELTKLVVIDTGCTGSCKSNYHTITNTMDAKSKQDSQYNDQIRKDKKAKNDRQNTVYSIQHYVIRFVSNLQQVGGFVWLLWPHTI
jgi:hypothetical protein